MIWSVLYARRFLIDPGKQTCKTKMAEFVSGALFGVGALREREYRFNARYANKPDDNEIRARATDSKAQRKPSWFRWLMESRKWKQWFQEKWKRKRQFRWKKIETGFDDG